ncbi:MAG: sodium:proton antiporter, partial [Bacteroidaceae bacterium]|nr:sodium:proton antiporter [Bacteroidaceae bacterium]
MTTKTNNRWLSYLPVVFLILSLALVIRLYGSDALAGGSQIALLFSTGICGLIAVFCYKMKWSELEKATFNNFNKIASSIIILLLIGCLSGIWTVSGIVPTLIYYGVQIIHPQFYLLCTCLICCVVSVMTGSSWTTIATVGIALLGIGKAQGFSEGWIAGAIISGAYFGDKVSPLSDTTILASSMSGTPLFSHIKYMLLTTIPSLIIALLVFGFVGFSHKLTDISLIKTYTHTLSNTFNLSLWLLVVPVVTGLMIAKRMPAIAVLFLSSMLGAVFAIIFQPEIIAQIG